ncbi:unnamed protein product [Auanema sp. JU1783]|nr:unnamed protein product [Auanema sp. JU1783]
MSTVPTSAPTSIVSAPTLGSGNFAEVVRLPEGEDRQEWLAVNIVDIFKQIKMVMGTLYEACTSESCPLMTAGPRYEYYWTHSSGRKLSTSAARYIDYVMTWVQDQLDDEAVFPSQLGDPFPPNFEDVCVSIMKRIFRVYAHVYKSHADKMRELKATAHLNTSFKQFILFALQFDLIPDIEMEPIRDIIVKIVRS